MRAIDSAAFNKTVLEDILKIKNIIDTSITPENIAYLPSSAINTIRDAYANQKGQSKVDDSFPDYGYNSNVNSMEMSRIRGAINYLKTNKTKVAIEEFSFNPYSGMLLGSASDKTDVKYKYKIQIPENYDGRNSFVEYVIYTALNPEIDVAQNFIYGEGIIAWKPEEFMCLWNNVHAKGQKYMSLTSIKIFRNKNEIVIDFRCPNAKVKNASNYVIVDPRYIWIKGRATIWRTL